MLREVCAPYFSRLILSPGLMVVLIWFSVLQNVNSGWQSLTPSSAVADYLSHLPASLSLHHFLKYSAESIKKESQNQLSVRIFKYMEKYRKEKDCKKNRLWLKYCFYSQNIDMAHTQNLAQGLGLNSLSSSLLSNAAILNQNQQSHMPSMQSQSQQQHLPIPQVPTTQQQTHSNGSSSANNNLVQTSSANNGNQAHNNSNGSNGINNGNGLATNGNASSKTATKKKKKKKPPKEKKPRPKPGEIRLTTALDGSTLYGCPECHMVYPGNFDCYWPFYWNNLFYLWYWFDSWLISERGLLEEHLVGHNLERRYHFNFHIRFNWIKSNVHDNISFCFRFICDICNAALKRKDHLTRHKQSHNSERPFVCTVCMKAFKRKEQLSLHFVIHSGEKRHVCQECGKGKLMTGFRRKFSI